MKVWLLVVSLACALPALADVSVTASVDQSRVSFGESVTFTIAVNGTQSGAQPAIPKIDGLNFAGPSVNSSFSFINGSMSRSMSLIYQVTPTRPGEYTIPAISVAVAGKTYQTEPIKLTVATDGTQPDTQQVLFAKVRLDAQQLYLGQTAPLDVVLFVRANVPLKNVSGYNFEANGLGYRYLQNLKSGARIINGETFNIHVIEGAISPTQVGNLTFGPAVIKAQMAVQARNRANDFLNDFFNRTEVREQPVTIAEVPIEVLPLPEDGKPADFTGAVGQWNLEVTAKPTEVNVGDPITLTVRIVGDGNIDTVATPHLKGLDNFKTYDPTSKTTKNELSTTGERLFQQVLIPKSTEATELPEIRLPYFDPVAKAYKVAVQGPIKLVVNASNTGASAVVSGATRARPAEKLGEDIVYLKGDLGPEASSVPVCATPTFWVLNLAPVMALAGAIGWKRRSDHLRGNVAYARRSRAARSARKLLAAAANVDDVQHSLQSYLGDRLNIPASGITASVAEEHGLPGEIASVFESCDAARFAGAQTDLTSLKQAVEKVIDELENGTR